MVAVIVGSFRVGRAARSVPHPDYERHLPDSTPRPEFLRIGNAGRPVATITEDDTAGLPGPVAADLLEAAACWEAGAYRAAVLMARRAVEQVVVMRGVPLEMKTLHQKLVWLLKARHLPGPLAPHARTVRDAGNAAAHGGEPVAADEARSMIVASLAVARAALLPG
jgi:hypothetical protein